jgi:hypothetical protein
LFIPPNRKIKFPIFRFSRAEKDNTTQERVPLQSNIMATPTPTAAQHMSQRHQQLQQQQQQQNQSAREADLSAQAALNIEDTPPVHIVQIVPLVQLLIKFPS